MSHHSRSTGEATVSLSKCFVAWLKATRIQTDFALLFSAISRFVKASALIAVAAAIGDSEWEQFKTSCRHSCLHRTPRYAYAVAQPHEHSDIDQSDNYSQRVLAAFCGCCQGKSCQKGCMCERYRATVTYHRGQKIAKLIIFELMLAIS